MKNPIPTTPSSSIPRLPATALGALAGAALLAAAALVARPAQATEEKRITDTRPASAASAPDARRTLKFTTRHRVPATIRLRPGTVASDGWQAEFRFADQSELHQCTLHLPKAHETVQPGQPATGDIQCTTPWQVYDNGLAFQAFVGGRFVGEGTIRP